MSLSKDGAYGWSAVDRDVSKFISSASDSNSKPYDASTILLPSNTLPKKVLEYSKSKLPPQTFNHSLRVFLYGHIIATQHFPDLLALPHFIETYFATCLLHDIGTAKDFLASTKMSFDFYGGIVAMDVLKGFGAPKDMSEAVAEAIIRHQDVGETGTITAIGGLVQVTTLLDNAGANGHLVHQETIESVVKLYPRNKWTSCFASTVREEMRLKPWAHSSHIDGFAEKIEANKLMEPYDA